MQQAHVALTPTQQLLIEKLQNEGKEAEAAGLLLNALSTDFHGIARDGLTPLQQASTDFGNAWHDMTTKLSTSGPIQDALDSLTSLIHGMTAAIEAAQKGAAILKGP